MATRNQTGSRGPTLKKGLGQHHLRAAHVCQSSVDFLDLEGADVLEIGAGGGVLTGLLQRRARRVICWEIDPEWAFVLRRRLESDGAGSGPGRVHIVVGDALQLDWAGLPRELRVTGNLPYNVGTRIILDFLRWSGVERAAFLVQREVADRLLAGPGDPAYGSLSVAAAAQARVERLGRVSRHDFRPPPKVDGAFVGVVRREPPVPSAELDALLGTVRVAFATRRKTLRNALAAAWGRESVDSLLDELGWSSKIRAETLALDDFVKLHRARDARLEPRTASAEEPPTRSAG